MSALALRAPFPYFGGKSIIAHEIWAALGADIAVYCEPFAGSLAALLGRPGDAFGVETVNDLDGLLCNAWRGLKRGPEEMAEICDYPVSELDLHARHLRLVASREELTERLIADPDYCDLRLAGWWIWGACCWIGSGWCSGTGAWTLEAGKFVKGSPPGVRRQRPHLGDTGQGVHRVTSDRREFLSGWFGALSARLERVRICSGDWRRVVTPSALASGHYPGQPRGIFFDPPYPHATAAGSRDPTLYAHDHATVGHDVAEWCRSVADDPGYRLALAGYEGDYDLPGWRVVEWSANGGMAHLGNGQGKENRHRERLWLSPHCLRPETPQLALWGAP